MADKSYKSSSHPLGSLIDQLESGGALLPDSPENVMEVVGVLKSYGVVLDAYWRNLIYISEDQFLVLFPFFKYFNGEVTGGKLLKHWFHDRINYEFAEYCMRTLLWHGADKLDRYLDSPEFIDRAQAAIRAKLKGDFVIQGVVKIFPNFLLEQIRQLVYYSALGQFWRVMSPMFLTLSDRYDAGEIKTIGDVVAHVLNGLVEAADKPFAYSVKIGDQEYELVPESAGLKFLMDLAVPYVETVFFRSFPFMGTVSYNAQLQQISSEQGLFAYGALYADPLLIGGAGIPPTLLMQDLRHFLPDYMHQFYQRSLRGEADLRVRICVSFQKSMFCVTNSAIVGLAPYPIATTDPEQQLKNRVYLESWMDRLLDSQLISLQACEV